MIKDRLGLDRCVLFRETCFGSWLDLTYVENEESLIHYMLQKQKVSDNDHYDLPLIYNVNGHTLHFGRREFCLISGFKLGWISFCNFREGDITFRDCVFPEKIGEYVKNIDLLSLIEDEYRFSNLSHSDSIRVCLLLSLEVIFMGHELGSAVDDVFPRMVEDLDVWNDFPWGEHMWRELYDAIGNVTSNHKHEHHKALEKNPNFVSTYSLSGFLLSFKIWILESSCVTDHWWSKLSEEIPRGCFWSKYLPFQKWEYFRQIFSEAKNQTMTYILTEVRPNQNGLKGALIFQVVYSESATCCQTSTKEVSLKDHVKALEGLCDSLMILPKEIKSLKARVYKLETIINDKLKSVGKQCDVGDKYLSDQDGEFFTKIVSPNLSANKDAVNELVDAFDDLVDENGVVEVEKDLSQSTHMKLALDKCGTNKRRYVNVLKPPMEEDTDVKVLSIDTLKKQNNVLDQFMIESVKISNRGEGEEDLNRPFKCIDKVYCNSVLEQFLITSGWLLDDHTELWVWYMWHFRQSCHDWSIMSCYFLTLLLQDSMSFYTTDEIYPLAWRDVEQVLIPINEPKRHWPRAQFHIQFGNVTFYDSQKTYDVEYRPWYVKMRSCLESKLPVLLHRTGVFASKGIDPTSYSIKFSQAQNVPKQGGVFGDCGVFVCLFLYRHKHVLKDSLSAKPQRAASDVFKSKTSSRKSKIT
ncbi:phospholipase-like, aminotransferase-like mobile domain protein [Tanacetum coccineum]